jgi:hypothetical protein
MSRASRKPEAPSIRPVAELFVLSPSRLRCKACDKPASIIDDATPLCGECFLEETILRLGEGAEIN